MIETDNVTIVPVKKSGEAVEVKVKKLDSGVATVFLSNEFTLANIPISFAKNPQTNKMSLVFPNHDKRELFAVLLDWYLLYCCFPAECCARKHPGFPLIEITYATCIQKESQTVSIKEKLHEIIHYLQTIVNEIEFSIPEDEVDDELEGALEYDFIPDKEGEDEHNPAASLN